jgi:hypothetical protein
MMFIIGQVYDGFQARAWGKRRAAGMDLDQVELTLLPAPDDPERVCYEIQAKLLGIRENLRKHRLGAISVGTHPAGDTHMGQFIITLGPAAIEAIAAVAGAWVQTRLGRRIRLKFDDVEVEVRTTHEIDALLKRVCAPAHQPATGDR